MYKIKPWIYLLAIFFLAGCAQITITGSGNVEVYTRQKSRYIQYIGKNGKLNLEQSNKVPASIGIVIRNR